MASVVGVPGVVGWPRDAGEALGELMSRVWWRNEGPGTHR